MVTPRNFFTTVTLAAALTAGTMALGAGPAAASGTPMSPDSTVCSTTVQYGSTGSCVSALQTRLNELGGSLGVDGDFGAATRKAVWAFQGRAELDMDGVVGPATQGALNAGSATIGNASVATITAYINAKFGSAATTANAVATCESSKIETNLNDNTNDTFDIGVFQVNTVHGNTPSFRAAMLGYRANIDEAYAIYQSSGWQPWSSSQGCWG